MTFSGFFRPLDPVDFPRAHLSPRGGGVAAEVVRVRSTGIPGVRILALLAAH